MVELALLPRVHDMRRRGAARGEAARPRDCLALGAASSRQNDRFAAHTRTFAAPPSRRPRGSGRPRANVTVKQLKIRGLIDTGTNYVGETLRLNDIPHVGGDDPSVGS